MKAKTYSYVISITGYGGEYYIGEVSRESYEFYKKHGIDIEQIAGWWDEELWSFIPEDLLIFPPGSPADGSNLGHQSGADMSSSSAISIENQSGEVIWECDLDLESLENQGVQLEISDEVDSGNYEDGTILYFGANGEKGSFFSGQLTINEVFDPKKLTISYSNLDGWLISSGVKYNGDEIDGFDGYDTIGKSSEHNFIIIGDEVVYEGRERGEDGELYSDEDTPDGYQNSPQDWEKSSKIKKSNPTLIGWYDCNYSHGTTYGSLYWNGQAWQSFHNGRPIKECDSVDWWQGFNWDTSDWSNKPKEPPEVRCKKCDWIGSSDEMLPANYTVDLACPICKAKNKNIDWISYDPDTKVGRENTRKYCKSK